MMKIIKLTFLWVLTFLTVASFVYLLFSTYYSNRFFPGVAVAGISLGGKVPAEVYKELQNQFQNRVSSPLKISYQDQDIPLDLNRALPETDLRDKIEAAYSLGRSGNPWENFTAQLKAVIFGTNLTLEVTYKKEALLTSQISQIGRFVKRDAQNSQVILGETITVTPAQEGQILDEKGLLETSKAYLALETFTPALPIKTIQPSFSNSAAERAKKALENVKSSPIKLHSGNESWIIDQAALFNLLNFNSSKPVLATADLGSKKVVIEEIVVGSTSLTDSQLLIDQSKLETFLKGISEKIDQPVKEAKFNFDPNAKRVREFQPSQEGKSLDIEQTSALITQALAGSFAEDKEIELPVKVVAPKVTTDSINSFGIRELLGRGISNFAGSIENRIYNIGLAASRINGTLVAPGQTFSFNNVVGEISGASGYKPAYVIKSGRTVLDDGGGVCQVSTTLFRAVLNAGLPVIARTAHAYRVSYYEQGFPPGLDATVFSPTVDFKFKNDTSGHILIQTYIVGKTLYFELYGTSDGRVASLSKPVIASQTPPPPELRQDDPTLPKGTVKQVDWAAWGANVSFNRTVTRGGETLISETFKSNFKPWQAVYLVGTQ